MSTFKACAGNPEAQIDSMFKFKRAFGTIQEPQFIGSPWREKNSTSLLKCGVNPILNLQ